MQTISRLRNVNRSAAVQIRISLLNRRPMTAQRETIATITDRTIKIASRLHKMQFLKATKTTATDTVTQIMNLMVL
jgi:hypothetical protein